MNKNKIALITGSSRGIGASTALILAQNGYNIAVNYLENRDKAEEIVIQAKSFGVKAISIKADLKNEIEIINMFSTLDKELGELSALVNNGAISSGLKMIEEIDFDYLEKIYKTNVFSAFICCREAVKRMKKNKAGSIVNVSSLAAEFGGFNMTAYASSKAAINNLTVGLSKEVADFGIRVNAVSPGVINTDAHKGITKDRLQYLNNSVPLKRIGNPEEVSEAIFWLLSEKSSYVTGSILKITGGK